MLEEAVNCSRYEEKNKYEILANIDRKCDNFCIMENGIIRIKCSY